MNFNKIRSFCSVFRIIFGLSLIFAGVVLLNSWEHSTWLFLGVIPLIAGITKFCPLCIISKKCTTLN